ncbi:MAG: hypothetical protein AB8E15_00585 [Bdellovibrionales bacterium]
MKNIRNNKGFASIEAMVMLFIMAILVSFSLGTFGVTHTAILNNIAARTYAMETIGNAADVSYFLLSHRNTGQGAPSNYEQLGYRVHGIMSDHSNIGSEPKLIPTARNIDIRARQNGGSRDTVERHRRVANIDLTKRIRSQDTVNDVWVKTLYGICLNAQCGGIQ